MSQGQSSYGWVVVSLCNELRMVSRIWASEGEAQNDEVGLQQRGFKTYIARVLGSELVWKKNGHFYFPKWVPSIDSDLIPSSGDRVEWRLDGDDPNARLYRGQAISLVYPRSDGTPMVDVASETFGMRVVIALPVSSLRIVEKS